MSTIRNLAIAVDGAVAALEAAAAAYVSEAESLDRAYRAARNHSQDHALYGARHSLVRAAIASSGPLAPILGISAVNPPITLASQHPE